MRKPSLFFLFFFLTAQLTFAAFSEQDKPDIDFTQSDLRSLKYSDDFLKHMGFQDYVSQAQQTLDTKKSIFPVSKWALEANVENFESLNSARKIGNLTYLIMMRAMSQDTGTLKHSLSVLTKVIIQQLKHFPQIRFEPVTNAELGPLDGRTVDEILELKKAIWSKRVKTRFEVEKLNLVKVFTKLIQGHQDKPQPKLVKWLDEVFSDSLWDAYTSETRQQNRYLGRAIILSVVKFLRDQKDARSELALANELRKESLYIENYVHGQYFTLDRSNNYIAYKFKSGDIAFEYSHGQEAFFTSLVVRPKKPANVEISRKYELNNSYSDMTLFLNNTNYLAASDKKAAGLPLGFFEQRLYNTFWDPSYANGFSHCGLVELRTDQNTGISMAWIWDTFPESQGGGGVRLLTPEGFSVAEKHLKIGFLRYDPKKMLATFKEQIETRDYLTNIWTGYSSFIGNYTNGSGSGPAIDRDERYIWKTKVDKQTVKSWLDIKDADAENWFQSVILPRVFDRVRSYVVSEEAVVFAAGLVNARSMLYCSQMIILAYLEAANFDLQDEKDSIPSIAKLFDSHLKNIINLSADQRIIAPNGLIWQSKIFEGLVTIYHNRSRVSQHAGNAGVSLARSYTHSLDSLDEVKNAKINLTETIKLLDSQKLILDYED